MNKKIGLSLIMLGSIVALSTRLHAADIHEAAKNEDFKRVINIVMRAQKEGGEEKKIEVATSVDELGRTPLMIACEAKLLGMAQFLLQNGAKKNINQSDGIGRTALHWACFVNNAALVELLLQHGAQDAVNIVDNNGETTLYLAIMWFNKAIIRLLEPHLSSVIINKRYEPNKKTILHMVCARNGGIAGIIKKILIKCTDDTVNSCDATGKTPLLLACEHNNLSMVQFLFGLDEKYELEHEVIADKSIHILDGQARTPLWWAVRSNNLELISCIKSFADDLVICKVLKKGIKGQINISDTVDGYTPLHCAIHNRHTLVNNFRFGLGAEKALESEMTKNKRIVIFLLNYGAKKFINKRNKKGETLLTHVCKEGDTDMILFLLEQGAVKSINKSEKIKEGGVVTPLFYVCKTDNQPVFDQIFKYCKKETINMFGENEETALYWACAQNNETMFKALFAQSCICVISRNDNKYCTEVRPLYWACQHNNMELITWLILNGARVTPKMLVRAGQKQKKKEFNLLSTDLLSITNTYDACETNKERIEYVKKIKDDTLNKQLWNFLVKLCFARSLEQVIKKIEPKYMSKRNIEKIEQLFKETEFFELYKDVENFDMEIIFGVSRKKCFFDFVKFVVQKNNCYLAFKQYFTSLFNERLLRDKYSDLIVICQ